VADTIPGSAGEKGPLFGRSARAGIAGAAPVRTGVRCVQHFPFLGLLPPPTDGWSDITELYVARYGVPKVGTAIWIRTCQHIDG